MDEDWQDHIDLEYSNQIVDGFQITSVRARNPRSSYSWLEYDIVVTVKKVEETTARTVRVTSSGDYISMTIRDAGSMRVGESRTFTEEEYFYGERSYYLTLSTS